MSYKKVLLGLGLAAVIAGAAVTATVGFAQAEDPPKVLANQLFMSQRFKRWMSADDGWIADELGEVMHEAMIAAFADALGLDAADLEARLETGEQMMDIALEEGLSPDEVWGIIEKMREDARVAVMDRGIEFLLFRKNVPNNVPFDCDEERELAASSARSGSRGSSLPESRFSAR